MEFKRFYFVMVDEGVQKGGKIDRINYLKSLFDGLVLLIMHAVIEAATTLIKMRQIMSTSYLGFFRSPRRHDGTGANAVTG